MLSFFPRGVLDEILNLIESVSEGLPSYSSIEMVLLTSFNLNRGDDVWFCVAVNKCSTGQCSVRTVFIYRFNIPCCQIHTKSAISGI